MIGAQPQAVRDRWAANQNTKGATSWVRVEAKDGEVALSGTVDTDDDKVLAEQIARCQGSGWEGMLGAKGSVPQ